jgi:hypothetical protein
MTSRRAFQFLPALAIAALLMPAQLGSARAASPKDAEQLLIKAYAALDNGDLSKARAFAEAAADVSISAEHFQTLHSQILRVIEETMLGQTTLADRAAAASQPVTANSPTLSDVQNEQKSEAASAVNARRRLAEAYAALQQGDLRKAHALAEAAGGVTIPMSQFEQLHHEILRILEETILGETTLADLADDQSQQQQTTLLAEVSPEPGFEPAIRQTAAVTPPAENTSKLLPKELPVEEEPAVEKQIENLDIPPADPVLVADNQPTEEHSEEVAVPVIAESPVIAEPVAPLLLGNVEFLEEADTADAELQTQTRDIASGLFENHEPIAELEPQEPEETTEAVEPAVASTAPEVEVVEVITVSGEKHCLSDLPFTSIGDIDLRSAVAVTPVPDGQNPDLTAPENQARQINSQCGRIQNWEAPVRFTFRPNRNTYPFTHNPLYFEDPNLERCGQTHGLLTDARSAALFFGKIPVLPFLVIADSPDSCVRALEDCPTCSEFGTEAYFPTAACDVSFPKLDVGACMPDVNLTSRLPELDLHARLPDVDFRPAKDKAVEIAGRLQSLYSSIRR